MGADICGLFPLTILVCVCVVEFVYINVCFSFHLFVHMSHHNRWMCSSTLKAFTVQDKDRGKKNYM